jgi:hypothetical protein
VFDPCRFVHAGQERRDNVFAPTVAVIGAGADRIKHPTVVKVDGDPVRFVGAAFHFSLERSAALDQGDDCTTLIIGVAAVKGLGRRVVTDCREV